MIFGKLAQHAAAGIAVCLLALCTLPRMARSQDLSTGSLNVTVRDPAGAVVNGAHLTIRDLETNDTHRADTTGAGSANIPYLNPAHYSLTVSRQGFTTKIYPSVTIQTNQVT